METNKVKITEKNSMILEIIKSSKHALNTTEIALKLGKSYTSGASYCNKSLKRLLAAGEITKITADKTKYKLNHNKLKQ